jgi:hypothetical protein
MHACMRKCMCECVEAYHFVYVDVRRDVFFAVGNNSFLVFELTLFLW